MLLLSGRITVSSPDKLSGSAVSTEFLIRQMPASENISIAPLIVIKLLQAEDAMLASFADMPGATKGYKSFMLHSIPMTRILSRLLILVMHPI